MQLLLVGFGAALVQDGLASIAFYPSERWRYNHLARLVRSIMGAILILVGVFQ